MSFTFYYEFSIACTLIPRRRDTHGLLCKQRHLPGQNKLDFPSTWVCTQTLRDSWHSKVPSCSLYLFCNATGSFLFLRFFYNCQRRTRILYNRHDHVYISLQFSCNCDRCRSDDDSSSLLHNDDLLCNSVEKIHVMFYPRSKLKVLLTNKLNQTIIISFRE